jgi:hypothetical protein
VASIKGSIATIGGLASSVTDFGIKVIVALVVVDILFPESTNITENIGEMIGQFGDNGLAGLIALLLFLMLYKRQ